MPPAPPQSTSPPSRLTPQERQRIEAEEIALAQALAAQDAEQQRQQAATSYRQEVREALEKSLRPRPLWRRWLGLVGVLPLVVVAAMVLRPQPKPVTDDGWGGILNSALMERCRAAVSAQTYAQEPDLSYPTPQQAAGQFSANADGKNWNGWAARPDGTHLDFVCSYSPALDEVSVEILH